MTEHELANKVVDDMDMGAVCEYATEKLAEFYEKNPDDFVAALQDYE